MTPLVKRLRTLRDRAHQQYRVSTVNRAKLRKVWVRAEASVMRAELKAIRRAA